MLHCLHRPPPIPLGFNLYSPGGVFYALTLIPQPTGHSTLIHIVYRVWDYKGTKSSLLPHLWCISVRSRLEWSLRHKVFPGQWYSWWPFDRILTTSACLKTNRTTNNPYKASSHLKCRVLYNVHLRTLYAQLG